MILKCYSIKDELNGYTVPIPMNSDEVAKRYFHDQLKDNICMRNQPADFSIWYLGEFDTETGAMESNDKTIRLLERGCNNVSSNTEN